MEKYTRIHQENRHLKTLASNREQLITSLRENRVLAQTSGAEQVVFRVGSISGAIGSICTALVAVVGLKQAFSSKK